MRKILADLPLLSPALAPGAVMLSWWQDNLTCMVGAGAFVCPHRVRVHHGMSLKRP